MKKIEIEIPEGKKAEWVNGVLTLVDEQPVEFKFKVGDKVFCTTDSFVYTILDRYVFNGEPWYKVDESGLDDCSEYELELYTEPKDITERIKTFSDACEWCEKNNRADVTSGYYLLTADYDSVHIDEDILAYLKLRIITCALNEGWEPTFEEKEGRWFVCADENATDEISVCSADGVISYNESAMLLFKSSELAEYAANQFKELYLDFCHKGKERS